MLCSIVKAAMGICDWGRGVLLVIGHGCTGEVALLYSHTHSAVLHPHHIVVLLVSHLGSHLTKKLLLLTLL